MENGCGYVQEAVDFEWSPASPIGITNYKYKIVKYNYYSGTIFP